MDNDYTESRGERSKPTEVDESYLHPRKKPADPHAAEKVSAETHSSSLDAIL